MGAFDPLESPDLPSAVRSYAAARRLWLALGYDPDKGRGATAEYARAAAEFARELQERGGRWEAGGLIYRLEADRGIGIEQAATTSDERDTVEQRTE